MLNQTIAFRGSYRYTGPAELKSLGRLAEPALARVRAISKDPSIRAEAALLLQCLTATPAP